MSANFTCSPNPFPQAVKNWHIFVNECCTYFRLLTFFFVSSSFLQTVKNWHMFVAVTCGLWGGLLIGLQTEYYTSNR